MTKDLYSIHVNNKVICRDVPQAHIRGVIYGMFIDQIKYMSEDALREMVQKTSEIIEEGVEKITTRNLLTESRVKKFCKDKTRDELILHMSEWFLKAEGYSLYTGK